MTITTRQTVSSSVNLTSEMDSRMDSDRSYKIDRLTEAGIWDGTAAAVADAVHHLDGVGSGLSLDAEHDGLGILEPADFCRSRRYR